jgi:methionyl-tRNA formyltransferase
MDRQMNRLRLAFMGTPGFAVACLAAVAAAGHDIAAVYTQPPRPAGRGKQPRPSPVQAAALARKLPVRTPASLKSPEEHQAFAALDLDAAVVVAYGLLLPRAILRAPRLGCFNVHASLLPRWRGAAPIQRAIMAGDKETGITIMKMDEGLDTGPILLAESIPIGASDTAAHLHDRLADLGARLIVAALDGVAQGRLASRPQPHEGVTYAAKLGPADERLDWRRPASELDRQIRALGPRPGAWFEHGGERLKVLAAEPVNEPNPGPPGLVRDDRLLIACGQGALRLLRLQRAGKSPVAAAEFLRGYALPAGAVLPA